MSHLFAQKGIPDPCLQWDPKNMTCLWSHINNQRNRSKLVVTPYCPALQFLHMQNGTFNQIIQQAPCALTFYEKLQHLMDLWLGYGWFLSCTFQFSRMSLYYFYNTKKYKTSLKNVLIVTQTEFSQAEMLLFQYYVHYSILHEYKETTKTQHI